MHSLPWLQYFTRNAEGRREPDWIAPRPDDALLRKKMARSLAHFQLGESGDGGYLLAQAKYRAPEEPAYYQALALFVREEKEHARLLDRLVQRFDGALLTRHWTHFLFRSIRRAGGLCFEIQVLVIAELVGTAYYRLLKLRSRDPVVEQVCELILNDESKHLEFHAERIAFDQANALPMERVAWSLQFQLLFLAAAAVAWIDHHDCLTALGSCRTEFFAEARGECTRFLDQLTLRLTQNHSPRRHESLPEVAG